MVELLISIGKLILGFGAICGLPLGVLVLLNARDRRHDLLGAVVSRQLKAPGLKGHYAVQISGLLPWTDKVSVDLWGCPRDQVWETMERIAAQLPETVVLEVNGGIGCRPQARLTLTLTGGQPSRTCRMSV